MSVINLYFKLLITPLTNLIHGQRNTYYIDVEKRHLLVWTTLIFTALLQF